MSPGCEFSMDWWQRFCVHACCSESQPEALVLDTAGISAYDRVLLRQRNSNS
jgi:hypothetical protein